MVQISIDTKHDSTATLKHVINLLQEELNSRGQTDAFQPMQVPSQPVQTQPQPSSDFGPLGSMPATPSPEPSSTPVTQTSDQWNYGSAVNQPAPKTEMQDMPSTSPNVFDMFDSAPSYDNPLDAIKPQTQDLSNNMSANDLLNSAPSTLSDDNDDSDDKPASNVTLEPY